MESSNRKSETPWDENDPILVHSFSAICAAIKSTPERKGLTEKKISKLYSTYKRFMEDNFGRNSNKPRALTKLPHALLNDFSINGTVHLLVLRLIEAAEDRNCNPYELLFKNDFEFILATLKSFEESLIEKGFLKRPVMFFNKVPVKLFNKLVKIVGEHGGQIVNTEEAATHIIEWNEETDNFPEELTEDYIRILDRKAPELGGATFVHWWYYPDSYNEWITSSDVSYADAPDLVYMGPKKEKWTVCCRFVTDCDLFNEWGNEMDYENENPEEDDSGNNNNNSSAMDVSSTPASPPGSRKKGRRSNSNKLAVAAPVKVAAKENVVPEAITVTEKMAADLCPPSIQAQRLPNGGGFTFTEISSFNESKESSQGGANTSDNLPKSYSTTSVSASEPAQRKRKLESKDTSGSSLNWFDNSSVSNRERLFLSEFLPRATANEVNRTLWEEKEQEYLRVRGAIIELYQASPSKYLSATDCRKRIIADIGLIYKTHEFLDAFEVINSGFHSDSRVKPTIHRRYSPIYHPPDATTTSKEGPKETGNASIWTPELDMALQDCVLAHPSDWEAIAADLSAAVGADNSSHSKQFTAAACLSRFLEMGIEWKPPGIAIIKKEKSELDNVKALDGSLSEVFKKQNAEALEDISKLVTEYIDARLELLEEKMSLVESVEKIMDFDRTRLEMEKKDILIQRAQLSVLMS
mmetsp:Transcript_8214/g.12250  ORF Transcript_8214/g.12250 Transcript_8214/m.12250 type:complete len:695 (-) Transcript_8214:1543-3627(-)